MPDAKQQRHLRALIREYHRLTSTKEQPSISAAEVQHSAASSVLQEIINLAYEPIQKLAPASTAPERVLNGSSTALNNDETESKVSYGLGSVVKPVKEVSTPVVTPKSVFGKSAGPLPLVLIPAPVNGLRENRTVLEVVASCNNFSPKPIQLDDSTAASAPSILITHKLAVETTKQIERRLPELVEEPFTLPSNFELEKEEEIEVPQGPDRQAWFLSHLGLCTPERFRELSQRPTGRRRRKTANPYFSSEAVAERRTQEIERKRGRTTMSHGKNKTELKSEVRKPAEKLRKRKTGSLGKHEEVRNRHKEVLCARRLIDQQKIVERSGDDFRKIVLNSAEV